ncbi:MAG: hypothetical protein BWY15_01637 [Firmicutes bacterium ADurb.Bin193]|nr:MAG: hypothetical protein BWY15_01637 [Firmicutes bacterium ADurb.Bin193]
MKSNEKDIRICPKCNKPYIGHPALSRSDNITPICPDCGTREALDSIGVTAEEQDKILDTIHRCYKQ